jgi:hypothetical protein
MKSACNQLTIPFAARPMAGLLAGLLCVLPAGKSRAQLIIGTTFAESFSGQASAVAGTCGGIGVSLADCGPLAASGGAIGAVSAGAAFAGGLVVGASHCAVVGGGDQGSTTASEAAVADVNYISSSLLGVNTVVADFVMARAAAAASLTAEMVGAIQANGLVINGLPVSVTGAANQVVFLKGGGFVIINEQLAGVGAITVNALHIVDALAGVDVVVASCTSGVTCGPVNSPPPPCDFLTGGGWITGTPSGAKADFGVAGGIKDGAFWGHLNYVDHGSGMHVKATAVTGYAVDPNDPDCRMIDYDVTIDGQPGKARVRACDKGEPGRNDVFRIELSNGYSAGGDLGGSHPGGGNIQLHMCQ